MIDKFLNNVATAEACANHEIYVEKTYNNSINKELIARNEGILSGLNQAKRIFLDLVNKEQVK